LHFSRYFRPEAKALHKRCIAYDYYVSLIIQFFLQLGFNWVTDKQSSSILIY
jgi:hypothetical protein